MARDSKSEEEIYYAALKEPLDARMDYVKAACGKDAELFERVESLLKIRDSGDNILAAPLFIEQPLMPHLREEKPGTTIGRYKLLERIGEGGMAVVYMAQQEEPIHRKVALKIIKLGMDTRQVIARFEAERQALALMNHPNIAKVLDAGATDAGRPYFVMELVQGVSITEYCDNNNLGTKDRLTLFIQVCHAVQHAHQKGIIHRDIKPTNVMVTQRDGTPLPKIIDFGIAKATNQRLTEKTLFTRYAHIIGTPAYMSPEQAELSDLDIDTRSDVYSLGVLLYELLTGTPPFSEEQLRKAGYAEMTRIIREQNPPKPSTRLTQMRAQSDGRGKLATSHSPLATDLDWIVMKALEKARDRRYDTVSGLSMDIEHHLKDEPILARAPGTVYCLRKFICRHRFQVSASLIISLLAVTLLGVFLDGQFARLEREVFWMHKSTYSRAVSLSMTNNLGGALLEYKPVLNSRYVGSEARRGYNEALRKIRDQVKVLTDQIEAKPGIANNYLVRAQQYHWLGETENVITDMQTYVNILNPLDEQNPHDLWFRDFLMALWRSTPTNLGEPINSSYDDAMGGITPDGLSLILGSNRSGISFDIWMTKRSTSGHDWGTPQRLVEPINTEFFDGEPRLSADGLSLYIDSARPSEYIEQGGQDWPMDIWLSTRKTLQDAWDTPIFLKAPINSPLDEGPASLSADGLELYFSSKRPGPGAQGKLDLWVARRATVSEPWADPKNLGPAVNSPATDFAQHICANGLILFFSSSRSEGCGPRDIWVTTRKTKKDDNWSTAVNLGPTINSPWSDQQPFISADGSTFYFSSIWLGGHGGLDIWKVEIPQVSGGFHESDDINPTQKSVHSND